MAGAAGVATGSTLAAGWMAAQSIAISTLAAGTPIGWLITADTVMSGVVIVAGEETMATHDCWEQVLSSNELDEEKASLHREHGILLPELATHCDILKSKCDRRLILRNQKGEQCVILTLTENCITDLLGAIVLPSPSLQIFPPRNIFSM